MSTQTIDRSVVERLVRQALGNRLGGNGKATTDGRAAWLQARTGNGVFVTSAAAGVQNATIDNGSVSDPSALTGANYTQTFDGLPNTGTFTFSGAGPFDVSAAQINATGFGTGDWFFRKISGSGANALFNIGTGSGNTGSM